MKLYSVPPCVQGIIFDIDNTLYKNDEYVDAQTDVQLVRIAEIRGIPVERLKPELEACARRLAEANGGRKPSLANTLREGYGIPVTESVALREELLKPEDFLTRDDRLVSTFEKLGRIFRLAAVTNNPGSIGRRTLRVLGIEGFFSIVTGLEVTGISKPALEPFELTSRGLGIPFGRLVNIGDRWNIDLELPLQAGLGGILVESMEDIYVLPEILTPCAEGIDP